MAIGRLSMETGKTGRAGPHAAYIAGEGKYARYLERGERLEASDAGNLPLWAQRDTQAFWQAADAFERQNGTTYREMEIALPRELDAGQRIALMRAFVAGEQQPARRGERHEDLHGAGGGAVLGHQSPVLASPTQSTKPALIMTISGFFGLCRSFPSIDWLMCMIGNLLSWNRPRAMCWMDSETPAGGEAAHIAHSRSLPTEAFTWWKVDRAVNRVDPYNNGKHLIAPVNAGA